MAGGVPQAPAASPPPVVLAQPPVVLAPPPVVLAPPPPAFSAPQPTLSPPLAFAPPRPPAGVVVPVPRAPAASSSKKWIYITIGVVVGLIVLVVAIVLIVVLVRAHSNRSRQEAFLVRFSSIPTSAPAGTISQSDVTAFLARHGWTVATKAQFDAALAAGAQWCSMGYFSQDETGVLDMRGYPMRLVSPQCGSGAATAFVQDASGNLPNNETDGVGVIAYGVKPSSPEDATSQSLSIEWFTIGQIRPGGPTVMVWSQYS